MDTLSTRQKKQFYVQRLLPALLGLALFFVFIAFGSLFNLVQLRRMSSRRQAGSPIPQIALSSLLNSEETKSIISSETASGLRVSPVNTMDLKTMGIKGGLDAIEAALQKLPPGSQSKFINGHGFARDSVGAIWMAYGERNELIKLVANDSPKSFRLPVANAGPSGVAVDEENHIWVTLKNIDSVIEFDPQEESFLETVELKPGARPKGIVYVNSELWVAESFQDSNTNEFGSDHEIGAVVSIDPESKKVATESYMQEASHPDQLVVQLGGRYIKYYTNHGESGTLDSFTGMMY